jgi:hypothetical protein
MAGIGGLDGVHRQRSDGVGEQSRIGGHSLSQAAAPGGALEESRGTLRQQRSFIGGGVPVNRSRAVFKALKAMYAAAMGQDRVDQALGRIERALARIENAAGRAAAAPADAPADDGALKEAHEALRGRVRDALTQLDGLIASAERG